ncbi:NAD(P)-binding domain-containing protein [Microvirga arabica]|uniref:NAD(P)-binding domain-containing protein n=1 Tax=Microvirga arabica TaxID=1128671 RepID=UPI00193A4F9C|nr:NAD(P)-binding domain-containing protein [Microvirga arabica]MBM1169444.1 NAD(P)-dependent oxidoreductase [Microvirga arabica]
MSLQIAFIGYGEVGQLFARQLATKADVRVSVYDILFDDPIRGRELKQRASDDKVHAADSVADACATADIVISAVTADSAIMAARQAAPHLRPRQTYIDLNSVSPATKRDVADQVRQGGAAFIEFAVMAPVSGVGIEVPILSGGATAETTSVRLNKLGMKITPVSSEIGTASATKLCRSIVIKGMEALMVDFTLAAEKAGVMPAVLASLTVSYPGMDWDHIAKAMMSRVKQHGVRRAAEMREASRMIAEFGLDGSLAAAIAERHESFARSGSEPSST